MSQKGETKPPTPVTVELSESQALEVPESPSAPLSVQVAEEQKKGFFQHEYRVQTYSVLLAAFLAMGYSTYQSRQATREAREQRAESQHATFRAERLVVFRDMQEHIESQIHDGGGAVQLIAYRGNVAAVTLDDATKASGKFMEVIREDRKQTALRAYQLRRYFGADAAKAYREFSIAGNDINNALISIYANRKNPWIAYTPIEQGWATVISASGRQIEASAQLERVMNKAVVEDWTEASTYPQKSR